MGWIRTSDGNRAHDKVAAPGWGAKPRDLYATLARRPPVWSRGASSPKSLPVAAARDVDVHVALGSRVGDAYVYHRWGSTRLRHKMRGPLTQVHPAPQRVLGGLTPATPCSVAIADPVPMHQPGYAQPTCGGHGLSPYPGRTLPTRPRSLSSCQFSRPCTTQHPGRCLRSQPKRTRASS